MKKKLLFWRDMLIIWAIRRFNIPLPNLLHEKHPSTTKLYYYYGRWFRLVPHVSSTRLWIRQFRESPSAYLLDVPDDILASVDKFNEKCRLQNEISTHVCANCDLCRIGLPCKKYYATPSRLSDLCLTHHYKLIKGVS